MKIQTKSLSSGIKRKRPGKLEQESILKSQRNNCFYCGTKFEPLFRKPHWDHLLPYSYCYNNSLSNFVAACATCNGLKSNKFFETTEAAIIYVQQERRKRNLPVRLLQSDLCAGKKVAEVLQHQMSQLIFLDSSQNRARDTREGKLEELQFLKDMAKTFSRII